MIRVRCCILILILALGISQSGCATAYSFDESEAWHETMIYSGLRLELNWIGDPHGLLLFYLLDLPFTFVWDTVLLPFMLIHELFTFSGRLERRPVEVAPK